MFWIGLIVGVVVCLVIVAVLGWIAWNNMPPFF